MRRSIIEKLPLKDQPSPGDVCIGCIHKPDPGHQAHFYSVEIEFTRYPDGHTAVAEWLLICDACFMKYGEDFHGALERREVPIGCDMLWPDDLTVHFHKS